MTSAKGFAWFERYGVELEYMIVDRQSLSVRPIADRLLEAVGGPAASEVALGEISWSNELTRHLIELKTTDPAADLEPLASHFQEHVRMIDAQLAAWDARLMPTAMHPWMDPEREMELWPHEHSAVYEAFDRIFGCRGHGWANLQSVHLNLPFEGDEQFGRLHAAMRLVLPLVPALAASSPIVQGKSMGLADSRIEYYRNNARRVPMVTGQVIPEPVASHQAYQDQILQPLYRQIAPLDPDGVLQHEWLNARGAIARFDRQTIELRLIDLQECPRADLAICGVVCALLRALVGEWWSEFSQQLAVETESLAALLLQAARDAEEMAIADPGFLAQFGAQDLPLPVSGRRLWQHIVQQIVDQSDELPYWLPEVEHILRRGTLATRITRCLAQDSLSEVYRRLCQCLHEGTLFEGPDTGSSG